jgi:hypothetical protein
VSDWKFQYPSNLVSANDLWKYDCLLDQWSCISGSCNPTSSTSVPTAIYDEPASPSTSTFSLMIYSRMSKSLIVSQSTWALPILESNEVWMFDLVSYTWYFVLNLSTTASYSSMGIPNDTNRPPYNPYNGEIVVIQEQVYLFELGSEEKWFLTVCDDASYLSNTSWTCVSCDPGKSSTGAAKECSNCPLSTYASGGFSCISCSAGKFGNESGLTNCFDCPSGYFSSSGSVNCSVCAAGLYSESSSGICSDCQPGFFSPFEGQGSCTACTSGYFSDQNQSQSCTACQPGYHSTNASSYCFACLAGSFSPNNMAPCSVCDKGTFSLTPGSTACDKCLPGTFAAQVNQTNCVGCPVGHYSVGFGSSQCIPCTKGSFSSMNGSYTCPLCDTGKISANGGMSACELCVSGFYNENSNGTTCSACPVDAQSVPGSSSAKQCYCKEGFYGKASSGQDCTPCRAVPGVNCGRSNLSLPLVEWGYFRVEGDRVISCNPREACQFTDENLQTRCGEGYTGDNCGDCVSLEYYRKGSGCQKCPSKSILGLQISAILLAITFCLWSFTRSEAGLRSEVKILFQALQLIATYPSLNLQFPSALTTTLNAISITNINVDIFSPECTTPMNFWNKFILKQLLPFLSVGAVLIFSLLLKMIRLKFDLIKMKKELEWSTFSHMFFVIWSTIFIALFSLTVSNWVEVFNCIDQGGGIYTLARSSSYQCYDATWNQYLPAIVIFGLINLIVSPGIICWRLVSLRHNAQDMSTQKRFAFLIGPFHPVFFYWELVSVLKRALIFFSLSFVQTDAFKYFLAVSFQFAFVFVDTLVLPYKTEEANRLNITFVCDTFPLSDIS